MKKRFSIFSAVVSLVLGTTMLFSSCGGSKTEDDKVDQLTIYTINAGVTDAELNGSLTKELRDKTGYDVLYIQASAEAEAAQNNVTNIFINKLPYHTVKVTKNQFYALLEQGGLYDISSFVEDSTNLKNQISDLGWGLASKDGKIYGIPQKSPVMGNNVVIAFRKDLLEKYNTENPSATIAMPSEENGYAMTRSDYKTYLDYVDSQDGFTSGMVADKNGVLQESILASFGIYGEWTDVNGKATYYFDHPEFQNYIDYMDSLPLSHNADGAAATGGLGSLKNGTTGACRMAFWSATSLMGVEGANEKFGYMQALVDDRAEVDGKIDPSLVRVQAAEGYDYFTVIPKYTKANYAKAAVDYCDKILSEEIFRYIVIGEEGVHYEVKDGEYYPILPAFDERGFADKLINGSREGDYAKYWWARARKNEANYQATLVAYYNIANVGVKNISAAMPPIEDYNKFSSGASADGLEVLVRVMYGDTSETLQSVIDAYNAKEGQKVVTSLNNWYKDWSLKDSYNKNKLPVFVD